jgi:hypothetical protein
VAQNANITTKHRHKEITGQNIFILFISVAEIKYERSSISKVSWAVKIK